MNKIALRTCIISHQSFPKKEMIRIVISQEKPLIDWEQRLHGRGIYFKNNQANLDKIERSNGHLRYRKYHFQLDKEQIESLKNQLK